mmetsp:Transcript_858/g.1417  ORF Transcript_858/g.1417 Transcript_858/m.1417 type:complete len:171 (+) Transcript_858:83-595(+)
MNQRLHRRHQIQLGKCENAIVACLFRSVGFRPATGKEKATASPSPSSSLLSSSSSSSLSSIATPLAENVDDGETKEQANRKKNLPRPTPVIVKKVSGSSPLSSPPPTPPAPADTSTSRSKAAQPQLASAGGKVSPKKPAKGGVTAKKKKAAAAAEADQSIELVTDAGTAV